MSDAELISNMSRKVNELHRDGFGQYAICKALAVIVREHDHPVMLATRQELHQKATEKERAKTLADVRPIVERLYVLCSKHVDIRHHDWNEVLELGKAIDGVEK